jgi:hypothetical protein
MHCPEYNHLRQRYEAAIRFWGQVILSPDAGALIPQTAEIKQKAFRERDAAKKRLSDHMLICPTCKPKLRVIGKRVN